MFVIAVDAMHGPFTEFNGAKLFLLSMIKGAFYNLMHCSPNHFNELMIYGEILQTSLRPDICVFRAYLQW
jgi:hypothetical protein